MTTLINLSDITPPPMVESGCPSYGEYCDEYNLEGECECPIDDTVWGVVPPAFEMILVDECSCDEYDNTPPPMVEQYKKKCDNDCGNTLSISTPIMCWSKGKEEKTLCNECYWDGGFYKDDDNEDNEEEIKDYLDVYDKPSQPNIITPKNTKQTEWKGRLGCYCAQCWEFCKMGSYDEWVEKIYKPRYPNINTPKNTKQTDGEFIRNLFTTELELINVNSGLYSVRGNTHSNEELATMIYDKMELGLKKPIDIENKELLKTYLIKLSALAIGEEYWTHYNTPSSPNAIEFEIKKVIDNNLLLKGKDEAIKKRLIKRSKYLTNNYGV
tara:strand:- start:22 stop:999 length:978 start_codon:yes stop_codon:yes gene_type:complete